MYSLKEAWVLMHGGLPFKNWNGRIYCNTTDAGITFRANETHGYMAAYTFTLVVEGWLSIIYNGQELTLHPDDMYIYSPGLAVIVRRVSGRTVIDYVNQHLLMEASFMLRTSQLSISQIADRLHFADTPSFSKFFSRLRGMSPRAYREGG